VKTLWLTYAWVDNENSDVDFIAQELRKQGIGVKMDRWSVVAGRRLWDQIGDGIGSPAQCDGWAIHATENSLRSEPCREELAIALDRALRSRGDAFPLIGIFPKSISSDLVPPAIRVRLYVSLTDPDWRERVVGSLEGRAPQPPNNVVPFHKTIHKSGRAIVVEVRPRVGRWYPTLVAVPIEEQSKVSEVFFGPSGQPPSACAVSISELTSKDGKLHVWKLHHAATSIESVYVQCNELPRQLIFGQDGGLYVIEP
jgi:hypothetical protein